VDVIFGCRVAVRFGNGVNVDDGEGSGVRVAGAVVDDVEVERAIAVGATVTEVMGSRGVLHAVNNPSSKNKSKRNLDMMHLAKEQRTNAIVR
jgi:hypothetical protein